MLIQQIYPEVRWVTEEIIIGWAKDVVATAAMQAGLPWADNALENLSLDEAIFILEDGGHCTFSTKTRHDDWLKVVELAKTSEVIVTHHSAECLSQAQHATIEQDCWKYLYPNYCRKCDGYGEKVFYESHGFRYGPAEQLSDPCDGCLGQDICPRCGAGGMTEDEPCKACHWASNEDAMPPTWECWGGCDED